MRRSRRTCARPSSCMPPRYARAGIPGPSIRLRSELLDAAGRARDAGCRSLDVVRAAPQLEGDGRRPAQRAARVSGSNDHGGHEPQEPRGHASRRGRARHAQAGEAGRHGRRLRSADRPHRDPAAARRRRSARARGCHGRPSGTRPRGVTAAGDAMAAIARATPAGIGNFRFAAAANVPAGTPFFPVAYHSGSDAMAIGLESPPLLTAGLAEANTLGEAKQHLTELLESRLGPLERLVRDVARRERRSYTGIDVSPAPGKDASIGATIEALTGVPFGAPSTLAGCAAITDVLKGLRIKMCGYSGLMLPVLEDPVLARRASEGRFSVRDLLLYSSVCGTGLDVVPLPGDSRADRLAALIADVAALSTKLRKPLSARLFPVPGRAAGEMARFDNPYLTDSVVLKAE